MSDSNLTGEPAPTRELVLIVAVSDNGVIGNTGQLPWHLPADLARFKRLTMGHTIIMGRRTFDSIGRLLPGRTTLIVTRQKDYRVPGALVVNSVEAALAAAADDPRPFVTGGGEIYRQFLPWVSEIQLTKVHTNQPGDTLLPDLGLADADLWRLVEAETHPADERNRFSYSFMTYRKNYH